MNQRGCTGSRDMFSTGKYSKCLRSPFRMFQFLSGSIITWEGNTSSSHSPHSSLLGITTTMLMIRAREHALSFRGERLSDPISFPPW
jgi:hypothetical protein